ncbi:hypothetical protein MBLNU459_g7529t1 [Dothideomycetes sp. NU459]
MDPTFLDPFAATSAGTKSKQVQDAKDMYQVVVERAARTGSAVPGYEFLELIGKGSFGRVYKCKRRTTGDVVAVKIIDVDDLDYKLDNDQKDEAIEDFRKEVNTLKHLKDARAKNINYIQEAFDLHSQLWIVSDYCPGGSVHTLMKPYPESGLEERYIIPIARELAVALKYVHDAGVIHRDVKCGNVLISEEGQLQLCDFGVAGIMENDTAKRSTIIGTPFWMAPELLTQDFDPGQGQGYGTEVDCWAFGCTVYEMATGMPPNHKFHPSMLRTVLKAAPRLLGGEHSQGLRDFIAFCLEENPQDRPTAEQILEHPYIADTSKRYPTATLRQMIDHYVQWERRGGQRASLFNPMGAAAPQPSSGQQDDEDFDDWNFSTTDRFEQEYAKRYSQLGIVTTDFAVEDDTVGKELPMSAGARGLTPMEEIQEEAKARRGEKSMERLFNQAADPYDYNTPVEDEQPLSDLPLRNMSGGRVANNRETLIDLDMSGLDVQPTFNFDFSEVPTLKAAPSTRISYPAGEDEEDQDEYWASQGQDTRRATKDWRFPTAAAAAGNPDRRTQDWTFATAQPTQRARSAQEVLGPDNPARRTQDWTFASATPVEDSERQEGLDQETNRRTQDWTFATAQPVDLSTDAENDFSFPTSQEEGLAPGFRPNLTRTATEPVGQFNDFLHPPAQITLTSDLDEPGVRDSTPVIDLDVITNFQQPTFQFEHNTSTGGRLSPTTSVAGSTATSRNPFFLDEVEHQYDGEIKRSSHGSSHRQSRSEPGLLVPMGLRSRSLSSRGLGSEPVMEQARDRGYSLSSTASSDTEGVWGRDYNRRMGEHTRDLLMNGLHNTAATPSAWAHHRASNSFADTDSESPLPGTGISIPNMDDANFPGIRTGPLTHSNSMLQEDADESALGQLMIPRNRNRSGTVSTMATSNGYDSSRDEPSMDAVRAYRSYKEFPRLLPPDADVLTEEADAELLLQEMDRLFGDLENGLALAADIFQRRDREITRGADDSEDVDKHFRGFTSDGDGDEAM